MEQACVSQREECGFIWYLQDGPKASVLAFNQEEILETQFPIRLKISLQGHHT